MTKLSQYRSIWENRDYIFTIILSHYCDSISNWLICVCMLHLSGWSTEATLVWNPQLHQAQPRIQPRWLFNRRLHRYCYIQTGLGPIFWDSKVMRPKPGWSTPRNLSRYSNPEKYQANLYKNSCVADTKMFW